MYPPSDCGYFSTNIKKKRDLLMGLRCWIFGHSYELISMEKAAITKGTYAKHEYDEFTVYKCTRCGKEIPQESYYQ